ncbi:hypothetical protein SAMN05216243_0115 [Sediminibacillus albus]|uniref:Permease n=2 Tax=Sediminibacillus albus TaxID=407036 RepID=A0A1G8VHG4_9BACI|nr:hypothetical protein SAMN05216243_0115 [Sediminibacillus albus]
MNEIMKSFFGIALELTILFTGIAFVISLISGFIPYQKMEHLMNKSHPLLGAFIAVGLAFVTPFCSCSTIPMVVNLLRNNVRFAIVMIFLFASPVLDITISTLMVALLGWEVTIVYILITASLSITIGFLLSALGFESQLKHVVVENFAGQHREGRLHLKAAIQETWNLIKSVYPFLIIGAAIGSILHGAIPSEWISAYMGGNQWWLVPTAAIIGIPLYIRLSAMIPVSQIMIVKGMALGPIMALLISSAGASLPEITLLHSIFKKKLVIAFIASVISMATMAGFLFYLI